MLATAPDVVFLCVCVFVCVHVCVIHERKTTCTCGEHFADQLSRNNVKVIRECAWNTYRRCAACVLVYLCVCMCGYIYYIYTHINTYIRTYTHVYITLHIYIDVSMHIDLYACGPGQHQCNEGLVWNGCRRRSRFDLSVVGEINNPSMCIQVLRALRSGGICESCCCRSRCDGFAVSRMNDKQRILPHKIKMR